MKCAHCLRGNDQRVNMDNSVADIVTRQVDSVYCITFTGGEPSLNSEIIKNFQYGFMFNDCSIPRVLFEKPTDDNLRALIWDDADNEDYTKEIVFDVEKDNIHNAQKEE